MKKVVLALRFLAVCIPETGVAQSKIRAYYEKKLSELDENDEKGYDKLACWCRANGLQEESRELFNVLLGKKRSKLAENPQGEEARPPSTGVSSSNPPEASTTGQPSTS